VRLRLKSCVSQTCGGGSELYCCAIRSWTSGWTIGTFGSLHHATPEIAAPEGIRFNFDNW
jgi:hypothetical protein